MAAHAKLSASGSHRWLNCPGSVEAESGIADTGSFHALEGTRAHDLADLCFENNCDADKYLGDTLDGGIIDDEMVDHVNGYLSYVRETCRHSEHFQSEQRLDFSAWVPKGFGTSDVVAIKGGQLIIIDLKYGKGVEVSAEDNSQMMLYALGAVDEYDFIADIENVLMCIYQPRMNNVSEVEITVDELMQWGDWVKERAQIANSPDAPRVAGQKQCQWCKAKGTCPTLHSYTQQIMSAEFDNLDELEAVDSITPEQVKVIIDNRKLITGYLDAVEAHARELAEQNNLPGYKLVEGRSQRKWRDEAKVIEVLSAEHGESLYERKLLSPAKVEKLLGKQAKEILPDLVDKPPGKATLAPESDKRKPIGDVSDCFDKELD